jgi:hypothetical protein
MPIIESCQRLRREGQKPENIVWVVTLPERFHWHAHFDHEQQSLCSPEPHPSPASLANTLKCLSTKRHRLHQNSSVHCKHYAATRESQSAALQSWESVEPAKLDPALDSSLHRCSAALQLCRPALSAYARFQQAVGGPHSHHASAQAHSCRAHVST